MQLVFRNYDQKALDDAYDQAVYAPTRDQVPARAATPLLAQRLREIYR
jgi:hypothetical protein